MVNDLPVIFRKERDKSITAVFPTLPADRHGLEMTVYAHIGQHSGASFGWYHGTKAAKEDEYAPLLAELKAIYERDGETRLVVCARRSAAHTRELERNAKQ